MVTLNKVVAAREQAGIVVLSGVPAFLSRCGWRSQTGEGVLLGEWGRRRCFFEATTTLLYSPGQRTRPLCHWPVFSQLRRKSYTFRALGFHLMNLWESVRQPTRTLTWQPLNEI